MTDEKRKQTKDEILDSYGIARPDEDSKRAINLAMEEYATQQATHEAEKALPLIAALEKILEEIPENPKLALSNIIKEIAQTAITDYKK